MTNAPTISSVTYGLQIGALFGPSTADGEHDVGLALDNILEQEGLLLLISAGDCCNG